MTGCTYCGGDIRDDHEAVVLASGDVVHSTCTGPQGRNTEQVHLDAWGEK